MTSDSTSTDAWGSQVEAADSASIDAWNAAWGQALHFVEDPFETLSVANETDEGFALGSVFCGAYRVLAGTPADDAALKADLARGESRARSVTDQAHVAALRYLVAGDFTKAGQAWDAIAFGTRDFAAVRFAHDVYLHVGDDARRLRSSQRAFDSWDRNEPGWGFVAGQLSFALEEAGFYDDAGALGREALEQDPLDLWSRHALAHLYETLDDNDAAFALLIDEQDVWAGQDGLAVHIWWHLALRLIATNQYDEALEIHDAQQAHATTPFRLCDLASLLWRLELVGVDVGDRWDVLANRFAARPEWHTAAFLDVHGALIYTRCSDHEAVDRFFEGVSATHSNASSENDFIFNMAVEPITSAIRLGSAEPAHAVRMLESVAAVSHRIGGSIAQREILTLTSSYLRTRLHNFESPNP